MKAMKAIFQSVFLAVTAESELAAIAESLIVPEPLLFFHYC